MQKAQSFPLFKASFKPKAQSLKPKTNVGFSKLNKSDKIF
jgi:hypothetical protein